MVEIRRSIGIPYQSGREGVLRCIKPMEDVQIRRIFTRDILGR